MKKMTSILLALSMILACETISYDNYETSYGSSSQKDDETEVQGPKTAARAEDFLSSIGVNTALNTRGETKEKTMEAMRYIGARWARCGYGDDAEAVFTYFLENYPQVKFSMSVGTGGGYNSKADFERVLEPARFLKERNALVAMEGANEPNNWGISYEGIIGGGRDENDEARSWVPVAKLHADFYAAVKADPILKDVDVWSLTEPGAQLDNVGVHFLEIPDNEAGRQCIMPVGTKYADVVNVHNYFSHPSFAAPQNNQTWVASDPSSDCRVDGLYGNNGTTWWQHFPGYSNEECKKVRKVTTETGLTINSDGKEGNIITPHMQGLMYMTCYLAQFARGWEYTSMYILRDRSDEAGNQTFGFFDTSYTPRLSAIYLHNLTTILSVQNSSETITTPGQVNYTIDKGGSECVHDLLLQKDDGTFALIVWGEHFLSGRAFVKVDLGQEYENVSVYNPVPHPEDNAEVTTENADTALVPVQTYEKTSTVELTVVDEPFIILFK